MYIELDENNNFVAYCENKDQAAPEHINSIIEITPELSVALQIIKPWKLDTIEIRIYDMADINLFKEILPGKSVEAISIERITALENALMDVMGLM